MALKFLVLTCLLGLIFALPLMHPEDVALAQRAVIPVSTGGKLHPEADSIGSSGKSGNNKETPTLADSPTHDFTNGSGGQTKTSSAVEIVDQFFKFLDLASELVDGDGTEKECNNRSFNSAEKKDCQKCRSIIKQLSACKSKAGETRKNCVCKVWAIRPANVSREVKPCRELISDSNKAGGLVNACGTAQ